MAKNNLVKKLTKLFKVGKPNDLAVVIGTDDQALPPPEKTTDKPRRKPVAGCFSDLDNDRDRLKGYKYFEVIDNNVPEFSRALTIIATNATAGDRGGHSGYTLEFKSSLNKKSKQVVLDLEKRLALSQNTYGIIRNSNKMGDLFKEVIVDKQGLIWRLKFLQPYLTKRVHDEYDRHVGFVYQGYDGDEQELAWWQVVHLRHDKEEGSHYGRSLFAGGGIQLAQRLIAVRDALTMETINHATARNAYAIGYPIRMGEDERDDWIDDIRDEIKKEPFVNSEGDLYRQAQAMLSEQDIFLPFPVDMDGNATRPVVTALKNAPIGDIRGIAEHLQDLTFVVTGVPKAFFGVERAGEGMGSTRLDKQDLQFARQLRRDQEDTAWFVLEVIRRQFVFLGMPLPEGSVSIHMPDLREVDRKLRAEIMELRMKSVSAAKLAGVHPAYIWTEIIFDGDVDKALEAAKLLGMDPFKTIGLETEDDPIDSPEDGDSDEDSPPVANGESLKKRGALVAAMLDVYDTGAIVVSNQSVKALKG